MGEDCSITANLKPGIVFFRILLGCNPLPPLILLIRTKDKVKSLQVYGNRKCMVMKKNKGKLLYTASGADLEEDDDTIT